MTNETKATSDALLAAEIRAVLDDYCDLAERLRQRDMIVSFSIANGDDGNPIKVASFQVIKKIRLPGEVAKLPQDNLVHEGQA